MTKFEFVVGNGCVELVTKTFSNLQEENPQKALLLELKDAVEIQLKRVENE